MIDAKAIAVDDQGTWPPGLLLAVQRADETLPPTECRDDLYLEDVHLWYIRDALSAVRVRLHHFTRLLPHEIQAIRAGGLEVSSKDLAARRLRDAVDRGYLTVAEARVLAEHRQPSGDLGKRDGLIGAAASLEPFDDSIHGVERFMTLWGGEALYMDHEEMPLGARLRSLGTPAIVTFTVPALDRACYWMPEVETVLVGTVRGYPNDLGGQVTLSRPVLGTEVEGVHTPGDPPFDAHRLFPRT